MRRFILGWRPSVTVLALLTCFQIVPSAAFAKSPVRLNNFLGEIDFSTPGSVRPFVLSGTASHLGRFECQGEAEFLPGETEGSLVGEGVAVFEAANGDRLVAVVTWMIEPDGRARAEFPWRDSVQFSDGTIVFSTGRFRTNRPPGALIAAQWRRSAELPECFVNGQPGTCYPSVNQCQACCRGFFICVSPLPAK